MQKNIVIILNSIYFAFKKVNYIVKLTDYKDYKYKYKSEIDKNDSTYKIKWRTILH